MLDGARTVEAVARHRESPEPGFVAEFTAFRSPRSARRPSGVFRLRHHEQDVVGNDFLLNGDFVYAAGALVAAHQGGAWRDRSGFEVTCNAPRPCLGRSFEAGLVFVSERVVPEELDVQGVGRSGGPLSDRDPVTLSDDRHVSRVDSGEVACSVVPGVAVGEGGFESHSGVVARRRELQRVREAVGTRPAVAEVLSRGVGGHDECEARFAGRVRARARPSSATRGGRDRDSDQSCTRSLDGVRSQASCLRDVGGGPRRPELAIPVHDESPNSDGCLDAVAPGRMCYPPSGRCHGRGFTRYAVSEWGVPRNRRSSDGHHELSGMRVDRQSGDAPRIMTLQTLPALEGDCTMRAFRYRSWAHGFALVESELLVSRRRGVALLSRRARLIAQQDPAPLPPTDSDSCRTTPPRERPCGVLRG